MTDQRDGSFATEITNNHGRLKRFVPESENPNKVCISIIIRAGNFLDQSKSVSVCMI